MDTLLPMNHPPVKSRAVVKEVQKGGVYRCYLQDNEAHILIAHLCGNMRKRRIMLCKGDEVSVELSPYDLHRGRITWRHS